MAGPGQRPAAAPGSGDIERVSAEDLLQIAYECPPGVAQVSGLLLLDGAPPGLTEIRAALADRIRAIPRLRQRMYRLPLGYGRPVWIDDARFDIARHVTARTCPPPADPDALLEVVAGIASDPLPLDRPLWSATLLTGLAGGRAALLLVLHHVLADGLGGLAVLGRLVDGEPPATGRDFPRPGPSRVDLRADARHSRRQALAALRTLPGRLRAATAELRAGAAGPVPNSSLNQRPTGRRRRLVVVRTDLAAVRAAAHAHGATVNDLLLTAIAGALRALLRGRGETIGTVVASVPVSGRGASTARALGNRVGVMRVALPATGTATDRLPRVTAITRSAKRVAPEASTALLGPAFRALAALRLTCWFINRQRLVNTFVTNVAGPTERLFLLGRPIVEMTGVSGLAGNVTVAFTILSYAGTLAVTLVTDPDRCPDSGELAGLLRAELAALTGWSTTSSAPHD